MPPELRCRATNARGEPCGAPARLVDAETRLCASHDPECRERMREAARRGGEATARRLTRPGLDPEELPPLETPQDAARRLDLIARAVGTGRLGHAEGRSMTSAVREWLRAFEAGDVAERMEELRAQLDAIKGQERPRVVR